MSRPERIGHVVVKVRDLERSTKFYTEVLGLKVTKLEPEIKMGFFASNGRDHTHRKVLSGNNGRAADKWRTFSDRRPAGPSPSNCLPLVIAPDLFQVAHSSWRSSNG